MSMVETVEALGMRCTCDRESLLRHLQVTQRGASTRTSIQVLAGIQLAARGNELHLAATDMELSVRTRVPADVEQEGVAVVPAKLLVEIVRLLSEDVISFALSESQLTVSSQNSTYRISTFDPDDFPALPETSGNLLSIDRDAFVATVQAVSKSASQDESRPVLTGVKVQIGAERLTMVATDSYRLSVKDTAVDTETPEVAEAIVPARALDELVRISDASSATALAVGISSNQVLFGIDETWVTARRIEGQLPNHVQLIPKSFEHVARIDRHELLDVVNRIRIMAQRNSPLKMSFAPGQLTVSARTQDVGAATENLSIEYDGDELSIGFNADFLRDGVQCVSDDTIAIQLISPLRPALLKGSDDSFLYLLMPVRLPD